LSYGRVEETVSGCRRPPGKVYLKSRADEFVVCSLVILPQHVKRAICQLPCRPLLSPFRAFSFYARRYPGRPGLRDWAVVYASLRP